MEEKKPDRRVLKTKKAIRNALAELLVTKDINDISIKDIADTADINRKTFYNYYSGVYQVIDEIENEIVTDLELLLSEVDLGKDIENPYLIFEKIHKIINTNQDFYSHLLKIDNNMNLVKKVILLLTDNLKESLKEKLGLDDKMLSIMLDYSIPGMITVYQNWFNSDQSMPLEELSKIVSVLCFSGFNGVKEKYIK